MFYILLLMLATAASYVQCEITLTQPSSEVVKPGGSLSISCKVSGYSVTDTSYGTGWIRQPAGKALEWINHIYGSGTIRQKDSLKSKFSISRDSTSSTITLQGQNLQPEDTAVYYCARYRYSTGYGFDYWGKGTMVTVSSGGQSPPTSIFPVSSCGPSSDGFLTLGCITSGFSPAQPLTFSWTGDVTGKVDFPAMQSSGTYTAVSQVQIKTSDWEAKKPFTCKATNPAGSKESEPIQNTPSEPKSATLLLTTPTQAELEKGNATFICLASQFSPNKFKFTWILGTSKLTGRNRPEIVIEEKSTNTFTAISILDITASEWTDRNPTLKCEFENSGFIQSREARYEGPQADEVKVDTIPPSSEDMLVLGAGDLVCKGTPYKGFSSIRWIRNGQELASRVEEEGNFFSAKTKITYKEWSKGTEYICEVNHMGFVELAKNYTYRREDGGVPRCPSVYLLPPPESSQDNSVTLTCYVKRFYPKDVVVYWLANDEKLNNTEQYPQRTTSVIEVDTNLYSVYSQLVVDVGEWLSGTTFSCLVYHEAINPTVRMIARSIDNQNNKPTLVSLSMNVPSVSTCEI